MLFNNHNKKGVERKMRMLRNIVLLGIVACSLVLADEAVKIKLTLDDAKSMALEASPTLAAAQAQVAAAQAAVAQAKSAYYPTLDLTAGLTRNRDRATRPDRDYDNNTTYSMGLAASYTLFDGFQRRCNVLIAEMGANTALSSCVDAQRLLLNNVSNAFLSALLAQDGMNIAKEDADFNRVLLDDARKRNEGGIATSSEVLNFELQVGNAEVNYINASNAWKVSIVALGNLLAMSQDDIWEKIELVQPGPDIDHGYTLEEMLTYASSHRPDLQSLDNQIAVARTGIEAARGTWYPHVGLFYNYGYERESSAHFNDHYDRNISYGISLSWNLFSGGRTRALINEAEANLASTLKKREELSLAIDAEIRQGYLALQSSRERLTLQEKILETAKKIRDLVRYEYIGGTASITRLNEVQTDVTNSASACSQARIQVYNNLESLKASAGRNLPAEN